MMDPKCAGQYPKSILHSPSPTAQLVVEYPLIDVQASVGEGFHHPGSEVRHPQRSTELEARGQQVILSEEKQVCYPLSFALNHCTGKSGCQNWIHRQQCQTS